MNYAFVPYAGFADASDSLGSDAMAETRAADADLECKADSIRADRTWRSQGQEVPVETMTDAHLSNAERISRDWDGPVGVARHEVVANEIRERGRLRARLRAMGIAAVPGTPD